MRPCARCFGWGIATGVVLWWVAALVWEEWTKPTLPTEWHGAHYEQPDKAERPGCFREVRPHVDRIP